MKKQKIIRTLFEYTMITFGALIMSVGIGVFLIEAHVVPGGVTGLSMALYYLTDGQIPIGLSMWLFNIPLFIFGIRSIGFQFGWRTFYGFSANAFLVDFLRGEVPGFSFVALQKTETIQYLLHQDFLFLILWGGALLGLGLGIIFKFKGTTAGTDIIAAILNKKYGIKPGQAIIATDVIVIIIAGFVIAGKGIETTQPVIALTMYAFFLLLLASRLMDLVIDGFDYARSVQIISDKNDEIGKTIMDNLSRGATAIKSRGLYRNKDRELIYTIVAPREVSYIYELIYNIDPNAFVIVSNVDEVMGEGFKRRGEIGFNGNQVKKQ